MSSNDLIYETESFKNNLINYINNSNLPPTIIYYIIKEIYQNTEESYFSLVNQIKMAKQQQQEQQLEDQGKTQQ